MAENGRLIEGKPAKYPATASAELDSKSIFQSLIDINFIKGELNAMDKYPNSDGILEITDADQHPIGKIDIQLKTLQPRNYENPCYQCERSFFVYCSIGPIPVILVAVNRQEKKAYWRLIDRDTLVEVSKNMTGESYSLPIPPDNLIDDSHRDYITVWSEKAREAAEKVWNYDSLFEQKKELENQVKDLDSKFQNPTRLPLSILKDIHGFLDHYNYILDREFGSVKQVIYPDFWKIGIGIIKYEYADIRFILYPVKFKTEQTLVKEVRPGDFKDISKEMLEGNVLFLVTLNSSDSIREAPIQYAYYLLEDRILQVAGKYNFPIADEFIAHEYLVSFIDRYQVYLVMDKDVLNYNLQDLKFKLYSVLPMLVATTHSFADWVTESNHDIDSYESFRPHENHNKKIEDCVRKIKEGFIPTVKVTITSELYNINLITYYINFLEQKGITQAERKFQVGQHNKELYGVDFWKTWNREVLWSNSILFFQHFYRLYQNYIETHFPHIHHSLQIVPDKYITIVHLFHLNESLHGRPHLEVYYLRPAKPMKGEILCFRSEDPDNPIDRKKFFIDEQYDCTINGNLFQIISMHGEPLDFMFKISPTYALINEKLGERLKKFFSKKKKKS